MAIICGSDLDIRDMGARGVWVTYTGDGPYHMQTESYGPELGQYLIKIACCGNWGDVWELLRRAGFKPAQF